MAEIGVAHLVRARNGLQPFRNFLESYARHPGGVAHDLLIIFKGFDGAGAAREYRELLNAIDHKELFISDYGFDLRAYSLAARHFEYPKFCFLNSFSVLLDDGWLVKMNALASRADVGAVGATGSCESMYSNRLSGELPVQPEAGRVRGSLGRALRLRVARFLFRPFPNYHLRTNAFMISRSLMLQVWPRNILTKQGAHLFESGKNGFTQRILGRGLKVLVAGRDGRGYEPADWFRSGTFRQANQENLLVADNQTRQYANADPGTQKYLSRLAWGDLANRESP